jgi:predicted signal transduction protein with EAL and GGDEF domain
LTDKQGEIIGAIELFVDINNQTANELRVKELEKLALLDTLTQLANRNFNESEMKGILEEKSRLNVSFGVLFMDIDHFKTFNDTYGHHVGDTALKRDWGHGTPAPVLLDDGGLTVTWDQIKQVPCPFFSR